MSWSTNPIDHQDNRIIDTLESIVQAASEVLAKAKTTLSFANVSVWRANDVLAQHLANPDLGAPKLFSLAVRQAERVQVAAEEALASAQRSYDLACDAYDSFLANSEVTA